MRGRWPLYVAALAAGALLAQLRAAEAVGPATTGQTAPLARATAGPKPAASIKRRASDRRASADALQVARDLEAEPWTGMAENLRDGLVITGATPHRLILFTFDDGPDRRTTPLLLDRLDAAGVKAVFFLTADRIIGRTPMERQQAEIARDIVRRGHMVASHTVDHLQLPLLDDKAALAQVAGAERIFEDVFGSRPWLIRPPGGARSSRIDYLLGSRGYTTVLWNLGAGDVQVRTAEQVHQTWQKVFERRMRDDGDRGGIILLHDTYPWSVDAFQLIVADLRRRNCDLLVRGEELFDIVDDPSLFHLPRGTSRPDRSAPPARPEPRILASRQARLRVETSQRCSGFGVP